VALDLEPVGAGTYAHTGRPPDPTAAEPAARRPPPDPDVLALIEPDPATMDLADARRVLAGGAGLVPRQASAAEARALFDLLAEVAASLGASMGATRVATDAGWTGHERQIGTTGVGIDPDLYVALGVSGASQHTGGLGSPDHVVSVNLDASCPMTALADLGLVTDATAFLLRLAERLGVALPPELDGRGGKTDPDRQPGASNPEGPPLATDPERPSSATDPERPLGATTDPSPVVPPEPREETRA
jgi:electron transfer flavoprotein alpha subunit